MWLYIPHLKRLLIAASTGAVGDTQIAALSTAQLRAVPGIGKATAQRIRRQIRAERRAAAAESREWDAQARQEERYWRVGGRIAAGKRVFLVHEEYTVTLSCPHGETTARAGFFTRARSFPDPMLTRAMLEAHEQFGYEGCQCAAAIRRKLGWVERVESSPHPPAR